MNSQSKYTPEMAAAVRKVKKPYRFTLAIVEHSNAFTLRVYEDEIMRFTDKERLFIMKYLVDVKEVLESFGVGCELEGAKGGPRV